MNDDPNSKGKPGMKKAPMTVVTAGARSVMARQKLMEAMDALADVRYEAEVARSALKAEGLAEVKLAKGFVCLGQAALALDLQMAAHGEWAEALERAGYELPSDDELSREMIRLAEKDKKEKKERIQLRWR